MAEWPLEHGMRGAWAPPLRLYIDESVDGVAVDVAGKADQVDLDATNAEVAGKQDALNVGSNGDQQATVGGVITNVKPGRIDVRQRGAVGDGTTDNTTLVNNLIDTANGAELWFPEGVYICAPVLKTGTRINGVGTIKAPSGFTGQGVLQTHSTCTGNVSVQGVTIDCRLLTSGIVFWDNIPQTDNLVSDVTIINVGSAANYEHGVRFLQTIRLVVRRTKVYDPVLGISGFNPQYCTFEDNEVFAPSGNAYGAVASGGSFVGRGNAWRRNKAYDCERHGIETFGTGGGIFDGAVIESNYIFLAGLTVAEMGYSIVANRHGRVTNNYVYAPNTNPLYGYEMGGNDLDVIANYAEGCSIGYITNSNSYCTFMSNRSVAALRSFQVEGSGVAQRGHKFLGNVAQSFRDKAFAIYGNAGVGSGGHLLDGNQAIRDLAWTGDNGRQVDAYTLASAGKMDPTTLINNTMDWAETSPTSGIVMVPFMFIANTASDLVGTKHTGNKFIKRNSGGNAYLNQVNGSPAATDIGTLSGNWKTNYLGVTTDMDTWSAGPFTS